jgi:8-oxo-dGTP diphosphatase
MMSPENGPARHTLCAGAVVTDDAGRLLVVLRANEPGRGRWSLPGGRVEPGELPADAAAREVAEETGLQVAIGTLLGVVDREYVDADGRSVTLEIHDYAARVVGGELSAGDDAVDVRWMSAAELAAAPLAPRLMEALADFGVQLV